MSFWCELRTVTVYCYLKKYFKLKTFNFNTIYFSYHQRQSGRERQKIEAKCFGWKMLGIGKHEYRNPDKNSWEPRRLCSGDRQCWTRRRNIKIISLIQNILGVLYSIIRVLDCCCKFLVTVFDLFFTMLLLQNFYFVVQFYKLKWLSDFPNCKRYSAYLNLYRLSFYSNCKSSNTCGVS